MLNLKSDLVWSWAVFGFTAFSLLIYLGICLAFGSEIQQPLDENLRVTIRTALYIAAIFTFPMINLLRHVQLRLSQTMPLKPTEQDIKATAKLRYLLTNSVSAALLESMGIYGLVMYILGDPINTLYILTGLAALGVYLYRPKQDEYQHIVDALSATNNHG